MVALALIDAQDAHSRQRLEVVRWPVSIGRALDNDLILDDPHLAPHHASLAADGTLSLLASRNGARLGRRVLAAGQQVHWPSDTALMLGKTQLRIRRAGEALTAEAPLARAARVALVPLASAMTALTCFDIWLDLDASAPVWRGLLPLLAGLFFALGAWAALWSFASKLFSRQAELARHTRIALAGLTAYLALAFALDATAFAFDWPVLDRYASLPAFAVLVFTVYAHLGVIVPGHRLARAGAVVLPALVVAGVTALARVDSTGSSADHPVMRVMQPPGWRLVAPQPLDNFVDGLDSLEAELKREARDPDEAEREYPG